MNRLLSIFAVSALVLSAAIAPAKAEGVIRISQQFGTLYIPFDIIKDQHLIEKHGKELGIDIKVEWQQLSGGDAVNTALLSGSIDVASAGVGPFFILWDKTRGAVKIDGAFGAQPNDLLTNNPNIKTVKDFGPNDRIASPAAVISVQGRELQMSAEQAFGAGQYTRLDANQVTLPHPDAAAALISGSTEITGHVSNSPFQELELKSPKVHKVWSSYDLLGGPLTPTVAYSTIKFHDQNPKTYQAFFDAFQEAMAITARDYKLAAATYIKVEKSKLDPAFIQQVLAGPDNRYTLVPLNTKKFADFLYKTGTIKTQPADWKAYTFPELYNQAGS